MGCRRFGLCLAAQALLCSGAAAQVVAPWGHPPEARTVALDVVRPQFDGLDLSFPSPMLYGTVRWPVSGALSFVGELPLALFSTQGASATVLGNFYVGIEQVPAGGSGFVAAVGARLPIASESGDFGGFGQTFAALGDFDRLEAWGEDTWALTGRVGRRWGTSGSLQTGFSVGATYWAPDRLENELLADYRAHAAYRAEKVSVGVEFTGRAIVTESDLSLGERTIHQLTLGIGLDLGRLWPSASLRVPLDSDLKDSSFNNALGLGLAAEF